MKPSGIFGIQNVMQVSQRWRLFKPVLQTLTRLKHLNDLIDLTD